MANELRTSGLKPGMFNAGFQVAAGNNGQVELLRMAMRHNADLPARVRRGYTYEVLDIKCRDVSFKTVLQITRAHGARGAKRVAQIIRNERNTLRGSPVRPKPPKLADYNLPNPASGMGRSSKARELREKWEDARAAWFRDARAKFQVNRAKYDEQRKKGVKSVEFKIRITRNEDGNSQGASFTVYRNGSVRCSAGVFIEDYTDSDWRDGSVGRAVSTQLSTLHDFMKDEYGVPGGRLEVNRVTGIMYANFTLSRAQMIRIKERGNVRNALSKKYKKRAEERIARFGTKGSLTVPFDGYSLTLSASGAVQVSFDGKANMGGMLRQAKEWLRGAIPRDALDDREVPRKVVVRVNPLARMIPNQRTPGVLRRGTTCQRSKGGPSRIPEPYSFDGVCPAPGYEVRANPQGFPCCYKKPKNPERSRKSVARMYAKTNVPMSNAIRAKYNLNNKKKTTFITVYGDPRVDRKSLVAIDDFLRLSKAAPFKDADGRVVAGSFGLPETMDERKLVYRTPEILRADRGFTNADAARLYARLVPWAANRDWKSSTYPSDDLYIDGRQASRIPKTALVDFLRRLKVMNVPDKASKSQLIHEIRKATLRTPSDATNYQGNVSVSIDRDRGAKVANKANKKVVEERIPIYKDPHGRVMIGKRVAKTFPVGELRKFAAQLGIGGGSTMIAEDLATAIGRVVGERRATAGKAKIAAGVSRRAENKKARARNVVRGFSSDISAYSKALVDVKTLRPPKAGKRYGVPRPGLYGSPKVYAFYKNKYGDDKMRAEVRRMLVRDIKSKNNPLDRLGIYTYLQLPDIRARLGRMNPDNRRGTREAKLERTGARVQQQLERFDERVKRELTTKAYREWLNSQPNRVKEYARTRRGKKNQVPSQAQVLAYSNKIKPAANR